MNAITQMKQHGAGAPVHIETNGFILRSLTAADATPRFLQWINSSEFLSGLNLRALNFTHEKLVRYIESFDNRNGYLVGIFAPQTGLLLGLYTLDVNLMHKVGNITTGVGEHAYEGKGVLWATIDALLDHFFAYRDIEKITARVLSSNRRMLFNFIGTPRFVFEARLFQECISIEGKRVDTLLFCTFKDQTLLAKAGRSLK
ncbi:hypothetical protein CUZ56_02683 [Saezia sanguinis]|uniref:N-acetyltransferase domain-containing protein n=1 Tax=Saezia sanguinis TaxID=1965230 RepID=A0A433SAR8_9BURK|nr:GNAT family protein [Saezia sanguinis]RUS65838.1 hypothetical protein CUZ56_02683 [Saezia sanguinis]